jgi:hypothetical protein
VGCRGAEGVKVTVPSLTSLPVWENFEQRILGVLEHALSLLETVEEAIGEIEMNERLANRISEANYELNQSGQGGLDFLPSYDGHQYPDASAPLSDANRKRPDFTWSWQDDSESSFDDATREFAVECKRLGDASGSTFNHRYVDEGIVRFVNVSHEYGRRGRRGAMVGYIQIPGKPAVLQAVQQRIQSHELAPLSPDGELDDHLVRLRQQLTRTFGHSPFELIHLWIDVTSGQATSGSERDGKCESTSAA